MLKIKTQCIHAFGVGFKNDLIEMNLPAGKAQSTESETCFN